MSSGTCRNAVSPIALSDIASDWIAHGIMDSIVDSFFPFLEGIEKEVVDMEALMVSEDVTQAPTAVHYPPPPSDTLSKASLEKVVTYGTSERLVSLNEKTGDAQKMMGRRAQFALPTSWRLHARRVKRSLLALYHHFRVVFKRTPIAKTTSNVHRMARTRRLVTSLTRVLAHKSEVVTQLQKRLLTVGEGGLGHGDEHDHGVYVYMGDVQGVCSLGMGFEMDADHIPKTTSSPYSNR